MSVEESKEKLLFESKKCPKIFNSIDKIVREVNVKLKMRGMGRGMVCIWEDVNKCCNSLQRGIMKAYNSKDPSQKLDFLIECSSTMKDLWISLRQLYISKALTAGELNNLFLFVGEVNDQLQKWVNSTTKAMNG